MKINQNLKKIILEELEKVLLNEKTFEKVFSDVKGTSSERTGQSLENADKQVVNYVYQIQKLMGFTGEELDGIYGPVTHASIIKTQGPYKPKE